MNENLNSRLNQIDSLLKQARNTKDFKDFNNIDLPFHLAKVVYDLLDIIFDIEFITTIHSFEPETLDAWTINLEDQLNYQTSLVRRWLSYVPDLPASVELLDDATNSCHDLEHIFSEENGMQSQLEKQHTARLEKREKEIKSSKETLVYSERPQVEIYNTSVYRSEDNIEEQKNLDLAPEYERVDILQKEKASLQKQLKDLQSQQVRLEEEITALRMAESDHENSVEALASELIVLKQENIKNLNDGLQTIISELEDQELENIKVQDQLDKAIEDFNEHQISINSIKEHLDKQYIIDSNLGKLIPANQKRINSLLGMIKQKFEELETEVAQSIDAHQESRKKKVIKF